LAELEDIQKQKDLIRYLDQKLEEQIIINKARYSWKIIRKRIKVVNMMGISGETVIRDLYAKKNKGKIDIKPEDIQPSRFIIPPNNYWKMMWGNFALIMCIGYVFLLPLFVSSDSILGREKLGTLIIFDFIFMMD
jgi:hypothetical protein